MKSILRAVHCRCTKCGAVEVRPGCNAGFLCARCDPNPRRNSQQYRAHKAVADAIQAGSLRHPRGLACTDCGGCAIEYDHRDYSKPLQVDPVCRGCNLRRGPAIGHVTPRRQRTAQEA